MRFLKVKNGLQTPYIKGLAIMGVLFYWTFYEIFIDWVKHRCSAIYTPSRFGTAVIPS